MTISFWGKKKRSHFVREARVTGLHQFVIWLEVPPLVPGTTLTEAQEVHGAASAQKHEGLEDGGACCRSVADQSPFGLHFPLLQVQTHPLPQPNCYVYQTDGCVYV